MASEQTYDEQYRVVSREWMKNSRYSSGAKLDVAVFTRKLQRRKIFFFIYNDGNNEEEVRRNKKKAMARMKKFVRQ